MSPKNKAIIELVYDLASPFSYIALLTLVRHREAWNLELDLTPVYTPLLNEATGDGQPKPMAIKTQYMQRDIARVAERWGVDIRTPAGFSKSYPTLPAMNFLRIVKENEAAEVLLQSTLILYEELYATQTPITSLQFYDSLLTSSRHCGPFSPSRLSELLTLSSASNAKEAMLDIAKYAWTKRGAFAVPWMIAYKVPHESLGKEKVEAVSKDGRESDVFMGVDRFDQLAFFLGPEYTWRGPWPDGDRFRPRSEGTPGIPIGELYPPAPRL